MRLDVVGFSGVQAEPEPDLPRQVRLKDASVETLVARERERVARAHASALESKLADWTPPVVLRRAAP